MDPSQVRSELRDGEVELRSDRVVDESFVDQSGPSDGESLLVHMHVSGDVSRGVPAITEICHRRHVDRFGLRGFLIAIAKETSVELVVDELFGYASVFDRDRRALGFSPDGFAPLLKKVGVSIRQIEDQLERVAVKSRTKTLGRDGESGRRSGTRQSCDRAKVEQPLRVRLGILEHQRELRQPRTDQQNGSILLADPMHRCSHQCQIPFAEELRLVEKERCPRTVLRRRGSDLREQFDDVGLGVARIGHAGDRLNVNVEAPPRAIVDRKRKRPQDPEGALNPAAHPLTKTQSSQCAMAEACDQKCELVILVAFHNPRADPTLLTRYHVGFVEQHCLANTP